MARMPFCALACHGVPPAISRKAGFRRFRNTQFPDEPQLSVKYGDVVTSSNGKGARLSQVTLPRFSTTAFRKSVISLVVPSEALRSSLPAALLFFTGRGFVSSLTLWPDLSAVISRV